MEHKTFTVKQLRDQLDAWEKEHNANPMNIEYLGAFADMPVVTMYYRATATKGLYEPCGLGAITLLNNPRALGIEVWEADDLEDRKVR